MYNYLFFQDFLPALNNHKRSRWRVLWSCFIYLWPQIIPLKEKAKCACQWAFSLSWLLITLVKNYSKKIIIGWLRKRSTLSLTIHCYHKSSPEDCTAYFDSHTIYATNCLLTSLSLHCLCILSAFTRLLESCLLEGLSEWLICF